MIWKVGDRAIVVNCPWWHSCGEETTLLRRDLERPERWVLDLPPAPPYTLVRCGEEYLKPIPDDNIYKKTSWEDCIWQPKELVRVG